MKIKITGVDQPIRRSLEHLIQLFYTDVDAIYRQEDPSLQVSDEDVDLQLLIEVDVKAHQRDGLHEAGMERTITAEARLFNAKGDRCAQAEAVRRIKLDASERVVNTAKRRTILQAVLRAMEQHTGVEQPWGILTGIRPTKLMHEQRQQGIRGQTALTQIHEETLVQPNKLQLMQRIVNEQLRAVPDLYQLRHEVSVYIGIPFCPTKCAYCTFPAYSIQGKQGSVDSFLSGLHYEIAEVGRCLKELGVGITTVYFGGGTPTSIRADEMDRLYHRMFESFPNPERIREITVEAGRPDTITREKLKVLKDWQIDRISINPQSYTQETLQAIGRHHTVEETIEKFWLAREMGMNNINMDLIIGLPGEGVQEFEHTLSETEKLMPESLTVHTLSFKRASEMTRNKQRYPVADRAEITAMMELASTWTEHHGYAPYYLYRQKNILGNLENIGYAIPGRESIYNIMIMEEMQTIIGLGCGASSKWIDPNSGVITRFANPKEPKAYNENVEHYTAAKIKTLQQLFAKIDKKENAL